MFLSTYYPTFRTAYTKELLGEVRILPGSGVKDGNYYKVTLDNGHYLRVNKYRSQNQAVTVVDENDGELGKIGGGKAWTPKALSASGTLQKDAPRVKLDADVPLKTGQYLDTQSDFGTDDKVPFVIRDSAGNEVGRLTPEPKDPLDDSDPDDDIVGSSKVLQSITVTAPAAIAGLPNGTAKTAALPSGVVNTNGVALSVSVKVTVKAAAGGGGGDGGNDDDGNDDDDDIGYTPPPPVTDVTTPGGGGGGCDAGFGAAGWFVPLFPAQWPSPM
jgi:hypothetical protein